MVAKEDTLSESEGREDTRVGPGPAFSGKLRLAVYWEFTVNMVESWDWINQLTGTQPCSFSRKLSLKL